MRTYKVIFADGRTLKTNMDANIDEAKQYYLDHYFQFGDTQEYPKDLMLKAVKVLDITNGDIYTKYA